MSGGGWLLSGDLTTAPGNTPDEARACARVVARHARNVDDARIILATLGLIPGNPPEDIDRENGRLQRWVDRTLPPVTMDEVREWCEENGHPPRRGIYGSLALAAYLTANPSRRPLPHGAQVWQCAVCGTWWPHVRRFCLLEHDSLRRGETQ